MAPHIARFWTPGHGPSRRTNVNFRGIVPLEVVGSHQKPRLYWPHTVDGWRVQDECSQHTLTELLGHK